MKANRIDTVFCFLTQGRHFNFFFLLIDPEEFLQSLLAQILQADPFLQLSSGQEAYHYQLFVDKDDKLNLPSVQTLFDQSFLTSDIKLKQVSQSASFVQNTLDEPLL